MTKIPATPKTTRTRKLGKAQERRLNWALATDDLLYAKFRRLTEDFQRAVERFNRQKQIVEVIGMRPDVPWNQRLRVRNVHVGPEGTVVVVELPPEKGKKS